jgi:hypothetical protein
MSARELFRGRTGTVAIVAAMLGFLLVVPSFAGSFGTGTYTCVVRISPTASNTCTDGVVTVTVNSGNQRVVQIDLNQGFTWHSVNLIADFCTPSGWTLNIGDSPTNNGGGGDSGTTAHDSEVELNGTTLGVYYSDVGGNGPHSTLRNAVSSGGCFTTQWTVIEDAFSFDDDGNTADAPRFAASGRLGTPTSLFDFPGYNESDPQDTSGIWADDLFVGLNRSIGTSTRSGSGLDEVCFFLSTSATPSAATIDAACGL